MSTPSFIRVLCKEGIIKFVYCHSDGYPSYLGKMLLEHYNTPELATALVDLGSLSMVRWFGSVLPRTREKRTDLINLFVTVLKEV